MSLFLVGDEGAVPFRRLESSSADAAQRDPSLASVLWGDLNSILGQKLFRVCYGVEARTGREGGASRRPAIVALDPEGNIVVVYVRELLDGQALAQCLECVGWARSISLADLAQLYWRGPEKFWDEWRRFSDMSVPPVVGAKPRMVVVSSESQPHTRSALGFLVENSVPVTLLNGKLFVGPHGECVLQMHSEDSRVPQEPQQPLMHKQQEESVPSVQPSSAPPHVASHSSAVDPLPSVQEPPPPPQELPPPPQEPLASGRELRPLKQKTQRTEPAELREPPQQQPPQQPSVQPPLRKREREEVHASSTEELEHTEPVLPAPSRNGSHTPLEETLDPLTDTLVRVTSTNGVRLSGTSAPGKPQPRRERPQHHVEEGSIAVALRDDEHSDAPSEHSAVHDEPHENPEPRHTPRRHQSVEEHPDDEEYFVHEAPAPPSPRRQPRTHSPQQAQPPRHRYAEEFDEDETGSDGEWA